MDLMDKMENENRAIKNAFDGIEDMEDISFSILSQIRNEKKIKVSINLLPVFMVFLIFFSLSGLLKDNFNIEKFINLITILNFISPLIKALISVHYIAFILSEISIIFIIIIFLVQKGCVKNEI
ncbi:MAG: hypothetical protein FWC47_13335 [Oscillospiraceae bacterium]|nr:hypothetical protein [Oscillospiraceae bacterium]